MSLRKKIEEIIRDLKTINVVIDDDGHTWNQQLSETDAVDAILEAVREMIPKNRSYRCCTERSIGFLEGWNDYRSEFLKRLEEGKC